LIRKKGCQNGGVRKSSNTIRSIVANADGIGDDKMANIVEEVTRKLTGLRVARKAAGLTQEQLADLIGTDRANIAGMESAARSMSFKMGKRLAEHVDVGSAEMVIANRLAAMKKAEDGLNPAGMLKAAMDIVKLADSEELSPEGKKFIDAIADRTLKFAGVGSVSAGARSHHRDSERHDQPGIDGRDTNGNFVGVTKPMCRSKNR
jgi:transcriptional regulator with XRE-family HTH domain